MEKKLKKKGEPAKDVKKHPWRVRLVSKWWGGGSRTRSPSVNARLHTLSGKKWGKLFGILAQHFSYISLLFYPKEDMQQLSFLLSVVLSDPDCNSLTIYQTKDGVVFLDAIFRYLAAPV